MPQLALRELPSSESEDSEEDLSVSLRFCGEGGGRWQEQWLRQGQGGLTAWWDAEFSLNGSWALGAA